MTGLWMNVSARSEATRQFVGCCFPRELELQRPLQCVGLVQKQAGNLSGQQ